LSVEAFGSCDSQDNSCDDPERRSYGNGDEGRVVRSVHTGNVQYGYEWWCSQDCDVDRFDFARECCCAGRVVGSCLRLRRVFAAGVMALASLVVAPPALADEVVCRFTDDRLDEISGMAVSRLHPNVLWVHNDSSGGPYLYAMDLTTCETLARITIADIEARDFEGLAAGVDGQGRAVLWLGDIGDNRDSWPFVWMHRIREPAEISDQTLKARTFRFTYPDIPLNAETVLADPQSPRVWVVTKQLSRGGLYELPTPLKRNRVNTATFIQREGPLITDGAIDPTGSRYVLRDYVGATLFEGLPPGREVGRIDLPVQPQGEAITWTADGTSLLVTSERDDRLIRVPVSQNTDVIPVEPEPSPSASTDDVPEASEDHVPWLAIGVAGILALAIVGATEVWRRR
jgi:hypothetical protein